MPRQPATPASNSSIPPMIAFILAIGALYFARQILVPFALALLCTFLLTPFVKRLEALRLPRLPSVLFVLLLAVGALGSIGWVVTDQLVEIVNELPQYRENIQRKVAAVQGPGNVSKLFENLEDLGKELTPAPKAGAVSPAGTTEVPITPRKLSKTARAAQAQVTAIPGNQQPVKVEVIAPPPTALQSLRGLAGPLLGPLEDLGLVIVFTIFMLIDREDLRNRLLGLIGQRQINLTTKALDDATQRVSRYLMMQFLVNAALGTVVAIGLYFIGVHSFILWGALAMLLRFLPYVGILLAGALPFLLSVATSDGWHGPLLVFSLFLAVEMITGNMVEPMLYGAHTGLSAVAILAAAVFWTALWGPVGLILATPLTVCLGVLGRYSPHLQFLDILLGDTPVLGPDALFYQRLLALDQAEAMMVAENYLRDKPLVDLYDQVIVPALAMAEQDRHSGQLEARREEFVIQSIREYITELTETERRTRVKRNSRALLPNGVRGEGIEGERKQNRVFCLAAHDAADEVTAAMFAQLAEREGFPALAFPPMELPVEMLEGLAPQPGDVICVSSLPPLALTHARTVSQQIREAFPEITVLVGLWRHPASATRTIERLREATASIVVISFADGLVQTRIAAAVGVA